MTKKIQATKVELMELLRKVAEFADEGQLEAQCTKADTLIEDILEVLGEDRKVQYDMRLTIRLNAGYTMKDRQGVYDSDNYEVIVKVDDKVISSYNIDVNEY